MDETETSSFDGFYRDRGKLVVQEGAEIPDRCVICNEPCDDEPLTFTFKRAKTTYIEAAVVQVVVTAASDLLQGAKYTGPVVVEIPFCAWHRNRRMRQLLISSGVIVMSVAYLFLVYWLGGANAFDPLQMSLFTALAFLTAFIGLVFFLMAALDPEKVWFKLNKFYDRFVWLDGAGKAFLDTLPTLESKSVKAPRVRPSRVSVDEDDEEIPRQQPKPRSSSKSAPVNRGGSSADNLSAEELIRRARLAGVDDDEDD